MTNKLNIIGMENGRVQIYNHIGTLVKNEKIASYESSINTDDLSAGIYLVQLISNKNSINKTITIIKK